MTTYGDCLDQLEPIVLSRTTSREKVLIDAAMDLGRLYSKQTLRSMRLVELVEMLAAMVDPDRAGDARLIVAHVREQFDGWARDEYGCRPGEATPPPPPK